MQITIVLMQLLTALLYIAGIAVLVVLFIVLVRLIGTLKKSSVLLKDAAVVLAAASKSVPPILNDVEVVTGTVRSGVEAIDGVARNLGEGVSSLFGSGESSAPGTVETVLGIVDRVLSIVGLFSGGKKKKRRKR